MIQLFVTGLAWHVCRGHPEPQESRAVLGHRDNLDLQDLTERGDLLELMDKADPLDRLVVMGHQDQKENE